MDLSSLSDTELYRLSINAPTKEMKKLVKRELASRIPKDKKNPRTNTLDSRIKW